MEPISDAPPSLCPIAVTLMCTAKLQYGLWNQWDQVLRDPRLGWAAPRVPQNRNLRDWLQANSSEPLVRIGAAAPPKLAVFQASTCHPPWTAPGAKREPEDMLALREWVRGTETLRHTVLGPFAVSHPAWLVGSAPPPRAEDVIPWAQRKLLFFSGRAPRGIGPQASTHHTAIASSTSTSPEPTPHCAHDGLDLVQTCPSSTCRSFASSCGTSSVAIRA